MQPVLKYSALTFFFFFFFFSQLSKHLVLSPASSFIPNPDIPPPSPEPLPLKGNKETHKSTKHNQTKYAIKKKMNLGETL